MWETVAMWGGVAGLFISIFAIIILYLTRKNILDILDKDVILFGRNFEIKKKSITDAFALVDEVAESKGRIKANLEFIERANLCYNDLLCVVSDVRVADEFYSLTLENVPFSLTRIAQFKIMGRKDIGLRIKRAQAVKLVANIDEQTASTQTRPSQNAPSNPVGGGMQYPNNNVQNNSVNNSANSNLVNLARVNQAPNVNMQNRQPSPTMNRQPSQNINRPVRPQVTRSSAIPANSQVRRPYPVDEGNE